MKTRPKVTKLLEENIGGKLLDDNNLGNNFLNLTPKTKATKAKINKWDHTKLKKLLHSKGKHQKKEEATYLTGGNMCKSHI